MSKSLFWWVKSAIRGARTGREEGKVQPDIKAKARKELGYNFVLRPIHSAHRTPEEFSLEDDY